ncbi:MAG: Ig-like domain-containing protein [Candidatus Eisenbacteria bacterium]
MSESAGTGPAWRGIGLALALMAAAGCAKKGPPSGGPPDLTPPRVIAALPDSGSARVPGGAALSLTFSETMEPRSTTEAISIAPRTEIRRKRWSGRTLTLELAEPLKVNQTYTLFVADGARDLHGNNLAGGSAVVFSTADTFPPGRIEGKVEARGFEAVGTALWSYDAATGREPDSTARDFDGIGIAGSGGAFRVDGLVVPGRYRIWAFADLNSNHSFEPEIDVLAPADTVFTLTAAAPVAGPVLLRVVNPRAPGVVRGALVDTLADSAGVKRLVAVADADSTRRLVRDLDDKGGFELSLAPGRWRLQAFRDLDKNRLWNPALEPASEMLIIEVEPAGEIKELVLVLLRARAVP